MKKDCLSIPYTGDVQPVAVVCNVAEEQFGCTFLYWMALGRFLAGLCTWGAGVHVCVWGWGGWGRGDRGVFLLLPLISNSVRSEEGTEGTKPAQEPRDEALWQALSLRESCQPLCANKRGSHAAGTHTSAGCHSLSQTRCSWLSSKC